MVLTQLCESLTYSVTLKDIVAVIQHFIKRILSVFLEKKEAEPHIYEEALFAGNHGEYDYTLA